MLRVVLYADKEIHRMSADAQVKVIQYVQYRVEIQILKVVN